jgi:hypothetical protein
MYAYSMAAAHEELPHVQVEHFMVSNVDSGGEGWPWVDQLSEVCIPSINDIFYPGQDIPTVAHYCQTFRIGEYIFTKRKVPKTIFSCDHPFFLELPKDIMRNNYYYKKSKKEFFANDIKLKRNGFMVCILYEAVNKALLHYKQVMCSGDKNKVNYEKTYSMHG